MIVLAFTPDLMCVQFSVCEKDTVFGYFVHENL